MSDFEVDLEALVQAAQSTAEVVQLKKDNDVEDYVPTSDQLRNDIVWDAVDEFQDRWEQGINHMTEDLEEVSGRLGQVATSYFDYDDDALTAMTAVREAVDAIARTHVIGG